MTVQVRVHPEELKTAKTSRECRGQNSQEGGLSTSIAADDEEFLSGMDAEIQAREGPPLTESA